MNYSVENRALKLKWHSIYGQILFDRKLTFAWKQVKRNKGSGGIDGETIDSFLVNEEENIFNLLDELKGKRYTPSPVRRVYIPKKNGKRRPLGIPNIKDRIVQQAIVNVLSPKFEEHIFHKWSCGYRPNVGVERVMQIIQWNLEQGYNYIYDADIKGFFDNIPHKRMMGVLKQFVADGTVLDLIWKWMKVGYLEEGKPFVTKSGTPQGGVISPLLANIYLNELDWDLEKEGIRFVRYADDFLLFAKSKDAITKASEVAKCTLKKLGLEISHEKTRFVDFNNDDFDFLGFTFMHWRKDKTNSDYYMIKPTEASIKDFKRQVKNKTKKFWTMSKENWVKTVNPIIIGKSNYYVIPVKAMKLNSTYGMKSRCKIVTGIELSRMDSYIRRRLRVCMIHKHPSQRKGQKMNSIWNNEFFFKIGLASAGCLHEMILNDIGKDDYLSSLKNANRRKYHNGLKQAALKGKKYFDEQRLKKMSAAGKLALNN